MRVLNLSLDIHILEKDSAVQRRLIALAEKVGEIAVFVPAQRDGAEKVSEHLTVYSFGGPKIFQLWKMWRKGKKMFSQDPSSVSEAGALPLKKGELRRCDLVTAQDPYFLGFLAVKLSGRFRVPVEVQVHGFEKTGGGRDSLARFVFSRTTVIRVVSERLKQSLYSIFQIPYSKIYVLPVYTQMDVQSKVPKRKTVPYPFTFLTVGRLVPVKNIGLQVRALAKVAEKIPHVRLRIVGDGPERSNLQQTTNNLQLGDKVIFEGEQKQVDRFYEESDAFLFTSDAEGWGRVVLEAAAHKLPIIMTDVGLAREVIKNNDSGFVIPVGDEHELVLGMKELIDKPDLRARLGEGAYRAFRALPSKGEQIDKQAQEWQTLIRRK